MHIERSVSVDRDLEKVFDYLKDFTHTEEWDPGTVTTTRESGDGGVGTRYLNTSRFLGRETQLVYTVTELVPNQRLVLRGENDSVVATDTMTFAGDGDRTTVTYHADFDFQGAAKLAAPLLAPALKSLGDKAEKGLRDALNRL